MWPRNGSTTVTHGPALGRSIREMSRQGDQLAVYDSAGQLIASTARPAGAAAPSGLPVRSLGLLLRRGTAWSCWPRWCRTAAPAQWAPWRCPGPRWACDHRIMVLWSLIAWWPRPPWPPRRWWPSAWPAGSAGPITTLAAAARRLGEGELGTRTHVSTGPPEAQNLSATFDTMAARIELLVRGNQALMADVSHQVRTPLAALRLRLDLLAQDTDEATATELAGAQEEIARLARMTNGLLAVARAENRHGPGPAGGREHRRPGPGRDLAPGGRRTRGHAGRGRHRAGAGPAGRGPSGADPGQPAGQRAGRAGLRRSHHRHDPGGRIAGSGRGP